MLHLFASLNLESQILGACKVDLMAQTVIERPKNGYAARAYAVTHRQELLHRIYVKCNVLHGAWSG